MGVDLLEVPKDLRVTLFLRCLTGGICNILYFTSIQLIEVSKASVLFWTTPMFTAIFCYIFLKEQISKYDWGAIVLIFIGVVII